MIINIKSLTLFGGVVALAVILSSWYEQAGVTFRDFTLEAGIDFRYNFGDYSYENILESSGSGITIFDYDGDGDMDIYMLNGTYLEGISDSAGQVFKNTPNSLYSNNGNGTYTEMAAKAGLDNTDWSMAAGAIDYDHDGDQDLYLLNYGPNVFYLNNGNGTFSDITAKLGLAGQEKLNGFQKWSVGVSFWDYDEDEDLDVMVGNFLAFDPFYVSPTAPDMMPHPAEYKGQPSLLYQQQVDGTFIDVTKKLGLYYPDSKCMGLTLFDYDDDGDLDLFQGNDHQPNFLFRNDGNLNFKEVAVQSGVAVNDQGFGTGSMHGSAGDLDGDGFLDLLVTDLRYGALYRNRGDGLFEDITEKSGIAREFDGKGEWAAILIDYDNDGDLDIFSANGTAEELIVQSPLLLENDGKANFKNVGTKVSAYFEGKRSGRAAASLDFDNDGDLDLIVSHIDLQAKATFLRNDGGNRNHWLGIALIGKNNASSTIGAKITVHTEGRKIVRINQCANSYLSYHDPRVHVGLGEHERIDMLEIRWSNGKTDYIRDVKTDQYLTIVEGEGIM